MNGPENHDPSSTKIYLNKQNENKGVGEANTKYIRKSRRLAVRTACSRCDLELVKIKPACLVPDSCKSLG